MGGKAPSPFRDSDGRADSIFRKTKEEKQKVRPLGRVKNQRTEGLTTWYGFLVEPYERNPARLMAKRDDAVFDI